MIYNSMTEAQVALNDYYLDSLIQVLMSKTNTITVKSIHSYTIVNIETSCIETKYSFATIGDFTAVGLQCVNNTYIYKFENETDSLYISYTSNGLIPILKDVNIINKSKCTTKSKNV